MNKYEVEFDNGALVEIETEPTIEEIFTEEYMEDWSRYFYDIDTPEGHLKQIAYCALKWPSDREWEGYGPVDRAFGSNIRELTIIDGDGNKLGRAKVFVKYSGDEYWNAEVRAV